ncbi:MAG: DUF2586 family protein [Bacteroidetes bacterium]|nr:MAG: DUF2586 family protein [Bacteroidota bacterium]
MALPSVNIVIGNGALGLATPTNDALAGMILQGPAASGLALATPKLVTSLQDAEDLGINAAYDTANSVGAHKAISEFYDEAGTGKQLWIMIVAQAASMATILDKDEAEYAPKLLNAANGGIRLLTVQRDPAGGYTPTITNGLDADVTASITNAQALAVAYAAQYKPVAVVVPAYGYNGTAGDLPDLKQRTDNRMQVLLGDTASGVNAAVGLYLGRLAAIPVMRNPGRVADGEVESDTAYLGSETVEAAGNDPATIHDKGFVTFRRHVGFSGYYFTDGPTATSATDDYSSIMNRRVIDKALYLSYYTYVQELLGEIRINATTGRIQRAQAKYFQAIIENAIGRTMLANEEIDGIEATVDPLQNVLSTNKLCVKVRITPVGYARTIEVDLGLINPANS